MSSMRNAAPRRPHRERAQPQARQKWGLLEKHKDYSLRAKDYNQKKQKLNVLTQKARERHPDEFQFGMVNSAQGKHGQRGSENRLSHDAVKLLKTQDAGYLRTAAGRTRRELEKAEEEIALDGAMRRRNDAPSEKVSFDSTGQPVIKKRRLCQDVLGEREEAGSNIPGPPPTDECDAANDGDEASRPATKIISKKQVEREKDRLAQLKADRKRRKRLQEMRANKLEVLKKRQRDILAAADELALQRAKMSHAIGGVNKNGVKFKVRERRR